MDHQNFPPPKKNLKKEKEIKIKIIQVSPKDIRNTFFQLEYEDFGNKNSMQNIKKEFKLQFFSNLEKINSLQP